MTVERYSVQIQSGRRSIVSVDDFAVHHGDITFLFGESGIGKSMISKAIYGLLDGRDLVATVNGRSYADYAGDPATRAIGQNSFFVFQEPSSHLNSLMKISEQLGEGSLGICDSESEILARLWQGADARTLQQVLDIYPKPYRPSGGEKQRILLAMAFKKIDVLAKGVEPAPRTFFVFDEPTGSLDNNYRNLFLQLLFERYRIKPFTVMIVTHDYSVISEMYAKHKGLLSHVHFMELRRRGDGAVESKDFSADEYLNWLSAAQPSAPGAASAQPVLEVDARFGVFGRSLCLCKDPAHTTPCNLVILQGEMVYVKAPSGVGKTTLAKLVLGLYRGDKLSMKLGGVVLTEATPPQTWADQVWGSRASMVFQHADESLDLEATVKETFDGLPVRARPDINGLKTRLADLFEDAIDEAFLKKKVKFLSGGQKQRLNLLRTIVLNSNLIIFDEPLNGLDFLSVKKVLSLLEHLRSQGLAILMISHNEEIFDSFVDPNCVYYLAENHASPLLV